MDLIQELAWEYLDQDDDYVDNLLHVIAYREKLKAALRQGSIEQARFFARIVVGLRIVTGEITVNLKDPSKALVRLDAH